MEFKLFINKNILIIDFINNKNIYCKYLFYYLELNKNNNK